LLHDKYKVFEYLEDQGERFVLTEEDIVDSFEISYANFDVETFAPVELLTSIFQGVYLIE